jgi:hypothetical protein
MQPFVDLNPVFYLYWVHPRLHVDIFWLWNQLSPTLTVYLGSSVSQNLETTRMFNRAEKRYSSTRKCFNQLIFQQNWNAFQYQNVSHWLWNHWTIDFGHKSEQNFLGDLIWARIHFENELKTTNLPNPRRLNIEVLPPWLLRPDKSVANGFPHQFEYNSETFNY